MKKSIYSLTLATLVLAGMTAQARVATRAQAAKANQMAVKMTDTLVQQRPNLNLRSSADLQAALAKQPNGTAYVVNVGASNIVKLEKSGASDEVLETSATALLETVQKGGVSCSLVGKTCSKSKKATKALMVSINNNGGLPIGTTQADAVAARDALVLLLQASPKLAKMKGQTRLMKLYNTYLSQSQNAVSALVAAITDWRSSTKYSNKSVGELAGLITANCK